MDIHRAQGNFAPHRTRYSGADGFFQGNFASHSARSRGRMDFPGPKSISKSHFPRKTSYTKWKNWYIRKIPLNLFAANALAALVQRHRLSYKTTGEMSIKPFLADLTSAAIGIAYTLAMSDILAAEAKDKDANGDGEGFVSKLKRKSFRLGTRACLAIGVMALASQINAPEPQLAPRVLGVTESLEVP